MAPFAGFICNEEPGSGRPMGESILRRLAAEKPVDLVNLAFHGRLGPADLTYVAETLGLLEDKGLATSALTQLARHPHPMVREGVVLGAAQLGGDEALALIGDMAKQDPSAIVRGVAADALDALAE
ncbi:MAG: HEAT repeat domain-containing protein [Deltaproteobacteria bacterium]|nr:HEAT repeat domain-containing protein [Deltaproteobacteria bacterium]